MKTIPVTNTAPAPQPFSFRLPAVGEVDPWFGGARTFWASLIRANGHAPLVRSFTKKVPGAKRGIRFIEYESARAFMASERQMPGKESAHA